MFKPAKRSTALRIIDLCAAPGGKSSHIARLAPVATVVSVERSAAKVALLRQFLAGQGLSNVTVLQADSTRLSAQPELLESFDCVLLDPPCSGLGQRPQFVVPNLAAVRAHSSYQRRLAATAFALLKLPCAC